MADPVAIEPLGIEDRAWLRDFLRSNWGSERMVRHGQVFFPAEQDGFVAVRDGQRLGAATYDITGTDCELTFIDSGPQRQGIGTLLLEAVERAAGAAGCARLWLVTTNDNLGALRFYQRRGFALCALHPGNLRLARALKPEIPEVGEFGIPLRDELDLEKALD